MPEGDNEFVQRLHLVADARVISGMQVKFLPDKQMYVAEFNDNFLWFTGKETDREIHEDFALVQYSQARRM